MRWYRRSMRVYLSCSRTSSRASDVVREFGSSSAFAASMRRRLFVVDAIPVAASTSANPMGPRRPSSRAILSSLSSSRSKASRRRVRKIRIRQRLSPSAAAKNPDVRHLQRFRPFAEAEQFRAILPGRTHEFHRRTGDQESRVMLPAEFRQVVRRKLLLRAIFGHVHAPANSPKFNARNLKLARQRANFRKGQIHTPQCGKGMAQRARFTWSGHRYQA